MELQARPARLSTADAGFEAAFQARLHWSADTDAQVEQAVTDILAAVQQRGDAAVLEFTQRFDALEAPSVAALELTQAELKAAFDGLPVAQREALQAATARVRSYHEAQKKANGESWSYRDADGTLLGQKVTPLDRVGIYVPGGKATYPSSVLMNAIPAHVAGVAEIIMVVPTPRGEKNAMVLAAAYLGGVTRAFTIGGAQAVAALAYGTQTIPRVDKITGPGNSFVVTAKRLVFGHVGIDNPAGPSEILVVADNKNDPAWIAADLLSQAEHDEVAQSVLITDDAAFAEKVGAAVRQQLSTMPRSNIATPSWEKFGALITVKQLSDAAPLVDAIAPEHLELAIDDPQSLANKVRHAGAIFLGRHTPEAIGDYVAGPNHVLPTAGAARFASGLNLLDFMKRTTLVQCDEASLLKIGPAAVALANAEGLQGHALSVSIRLPKGAV